LAIGRVTVHAKMLRLKLLRAKADLERALETWVPNCTKSGLDVHWVGGLGVSPGQWARTRSPRRMASRLCSGFTSGGFWPIPPGSEDVRNVTGTAPRPMPFDTVTEKAEADRAGPPHKSVLTRWSARFRLALSRTKPYILVAGALYLGAFL
jgi:hypothetical protein